ncbi:hypothetical protein ACFP2F_14515 [Hymenobacter artigasi]|uniref:Uncharacterized protein n=1 Tax=Hymenobacter artigasi TaxID=2719616 RepID=A0ABX1HKU7_9BACT|nr:hypothetical protein [Hymenobacter artigasi]NKI90830.1 hypothetical protein [Hymenobacter artigasi]
MKLLLPLLLALLLKLLVAGLPAVRVTFSPLTKAAYLALSCKTVYYRPFWWLNNYFELEQCGYNS